MEAGSRRRINPEPAAFHGCRSTDHEVRAMKWETPQAIDTRFGFEITMYISNR
jgi:coenzyme PQQ precursor peptide PqqA